MKKSTLQTKLILALVALILLCSCVRDRNFDAPDDLCNDAMVANTTFAQIKDLYAEGVIQIQEDLIAEGYVISSDKEGNFFGALYLQDKPENPTDGLEIAVDLRDSYLFYGPGSKVFVKLKGLYLGKSKGAYLVGGVFNSFGNLSIGRLPGTQVTQHLFKACDAPVVVQPTITTLETLDDSMGNTLVQLKNMEFVQEALGEPYAVFQEETKRRLKDCDGNEIVLLNSGYSNFQANPLPEGNGTIAAVLLKENKNFYLVIRDLNDIDFTGERCPPDKVTSNKVLLSELADPSNNPPNARFVELYNSDASPLSLKGWTLRRYTNASTEVSSTIDLSGFVMDAQSTLVISPDAAAFETVYGFAPDFGVATGGPADSNGDDNLELVDPFGVVIDRFGVIGEKGSGTNHEFTDGKAVRNMEITKGNPVYDFSEWTLYNTKGAAGTIAQPQNAPEDFSPGIR